LGFAFLCGICRRWRQTGASVVQERLTLLHFGAFALTKRENPTADDSSLRLIQFLNSAFADPRGLTGLSAQHFH